MNCTFVDDYNEKHRLCNPCKLRGGNIVQIQGCTSCFEEICDSHNSGFLGPNCHYDKYDQWENTYPGPIAKQP